MACRTPCNILAELLNNPFEVDDALPQLVFSVGAVFAFLVQAVLKSLFGVGVQQTIGLD